MSNKVISVENISKRYKIGLRQSYETLRDHLAAFSKRLWSNSGERRPDPDDVIWALKDLSFQVDRGEILGIIGRNGAGKSTLLKILTRITAPTEGHAGIRGRVGSLLEVGTGFHPELTGRENIYLNGAILGMRKNEIDRKFDEIVAFSEVEKFIDTPVKRYSSGMYMRLAFAVAAHLEQEILMIDEVLAVGDMAFQKKCLGKMGDVARQGRTILFVSHNLAAVQRLCHKGIYLESGRLKEWGNIAPVLEAYQQSGNRAGADSAIEQSVVVKENEARFVKWRFLDSSTQLDHSCYSREPCRFSFTLVCRRRVTSAYVGFALWNLSGELILAASSLDNGNDYYTFDEGVHTLIMQVRLPIKAGMYQIDVSLNSHVDGGQLDRWIALPNLNVLPQLHSNLAEVWHGLLNEEVSFELTREDLRSIEMQGMLDINEHN